MRLHRLFREPLILWESQDYASILNPLKKLAPDHQWEAVEREIENARRILRRADRIMWWTRWYRLALARDLAVYKTSAIDDAVVQRLLDDYNRKAGRRFLPKNVPSVREVLQSLASFAHYLSLPIPSIQNYQFGFQLPREMLSKFAVFEIDWQETAGDDDPKRRFAFDRKLALGEEVLISFPDGSEWININKANCDREATAMTHCGNRPRSGTRDRLLSLRRYVDPTDGKIVHRTEQGWVREDNRAPTADVAVVPMLTFILDENGFLGEMKGPKNNKPGARHYEHIVALLRLPFVKGITKGHWAPENDFKVAWLPEATQDALWNEKPALFHDKDLKAFLTRRTDIPVTDQMARLLDADSLFQLVMARPDMPVSDHALTMFRERIAPSHIAEFVRARPDLSHEQRLRLIKDWNGAIAYLMASPEITEISKDLALKLTAAPATKMKDLLASRTFTRESLIELAKYDADFLNYIGSKRLDPELAEIAARNSDDAERIRKKVPARLHSREVLRSYWTRKARDAHVRDITQIPPDLLTPEAAVDVMMRMFSFRTLRPEQIEGLLPEDVWRSPMVQQMYWDERARREWDLRASDLPSFGVPSDWTIISMSIRHPEDIADYWDAGRLDADMIWRIITNRHTPTSSYREQTIPNYRTLAESPADMVRTHPRANEIQSMLTDDVRQFHQSSQRSYGGHQPTPQAARELLRVFGHDLTAGAVDALVRGGYADAGSLPEGTLDRDDLQNSTKDMAKMMGASWEGLATKWSDLGSSDAAYVLTALIAATGRARLDMIGFDPVTDKGVLHGVFNKLKSMEFKDNGIFHDFKRAGLLDDGMRRVLAAMGLMPIKEMRESEIEEAEKMSGSMRGLNYRIRNHPEEMADLPLWAQKGAVRHVIFQKRLWRYTDPRVATDEMVRYAMDGWTARNDPDHYHSRLTDDAVMAAPDAETLRNWLARVPESNIDIATKDRVTRAGFEVGPRSDDEWNTFPLKNQKRGY